jgi:hypothetical protein
MRFARQEIAARAARLEGRKQVVAAAAPLLLYFE